MAGRLSSVRSRRGSPRWHRVNYHELPDRDVEPWCRWFGWQLANALTPDMPQRCRLHAEGVRLESRSVPIS